MNEDISLGLAIIIVVFLLIGASLTLIGAIGLTRAQNFYQRLHMPTLGTSCGIGSIIIASIIYSFYADHRLIVHEILLSLFLVVTTPVTLMLISRASMHRDQSGDWMEKNHEYLPQSLEAELERFKKEQEIPAHRTKKAPEGKTNTVKTALKTKATKIVKQAKKNIKSQTKNNSDKNKKD